MPHIRIRALNETTVQKLSVELPLELSRILNTPIDNFTVEKISTTFYKNGNETKGDPMIEILWFDRGQDVKDKCGHRVTEIVRQYSKAEYIAVIFTALPKESYYENGEHF